MFESFSGRNFIGLDGILQDRRYTIPDSAGGRESCLHGRRVSTPYPISISRTGRVPKHNQEIRYGIADLALVFQHSRIVCMVFSDVLRDVKDPLTGIGMRQSPA